MTYDLKNKTVLISGANRSIGASLVKAIIENGQAKRVYAAVRNVDSETGLVETYGSDKVTPIHVDLSDPTSIQKASKEANDVDVVINNAGVLKVAGALDEAAASSLEYETNINVYGLLHMAQAFAPVLKENGGGVFVQLNSVASMTAFGDFATYSASKAAAYSITQALRQALQEQGTSVVSVHPGPIDTDMANEAGFSEIAQSPELVANAVVEAIREEAFHVFPDDVARKIGVAYESFATNVIEATPAAAEEQVVEA